MKLKSVSLILISFLLISCDSSNYRSALLYEAKDNKTIDYSEVNNDEVFATFLENKTKFDEKMVSSFIEYNEEYLNNDEFLISPTSLFSAFSMFATLTENNTNLLKFLSQEENSLLKYSSTLIDSLNFSNSKSDKVSYFNSLWLDKNETYKEEGINIATDNNRADIFEIEPTSIETPKIINNYISNKTNKLLGWKGEPFSEDFACLILNVLYLKSAWEGFDDLIEIRDKYIFTDGEGNKNSDATFLDSGYRSGALIEKNEYFRLRVPLRLGLDFEFFVPKDGYSLSDLYKETVLNGIIRKENYYPNDSISYKTRTIFPEFTKEGSYNFNNYLKNYYGLDETLKVSPNKLIDEVWFISSMLHQTKLIVNKEGVEGAAYTAINGDTGVANEGVIKETLIVDRPFMYKIVDSYSNILFIGTVNKL